MSEDPPEKAIATACAAAALEGIVATPSRDELGRRTLILTRGVWTREVLVDQLQDAIAEAREHR